MKARGISQSELARRVGVSRQAVSLWLRQAGQVNVRARHLLRVSSALGVSAEELVESLPCCEPDRRDTLRTRYLWDRLYPDIDDFAIALNRNEPKALARLVEIEGLYRAEKVLGARVWKQFEDYKRHIHPARRLQLEVLCAWRSHRTAAWPDAFSRARSTGP